MNVKHKFHFRRTISAYLGVTEPALFGVNVKYVYPLVAGMSASALSGLLSAVFGVQANSIGIGGLPAILSIKPQYWAIFAIIMIVDIVVAMVLTFLLPQNWIFNENRGRWACTRSA